MELLGELRRELEAIYGRRLRKVILYGSSARGQAVEGSDVDVMIVLAGDVSPGEEIARVGGVASRLSLEADVLLSCCFVSEDRFAGEDNPLLRNVRREGIGV